MQLFMLSVTLTDPLKKKNDTSHSLRCTISILHDCFCLGFSIRSSNVPAKRKTQKMKTKKKLMNVPERLDDESSCSSESERSDSSDDDFVESELSDVSDSQSDWDEDSPMYPSDIADDSAGSECCSHQSHYSDVGSDSGI